MVSRPPAPTMPAPTRGPIPLRMRRFGLLGLLLGLVSCEAAQGQVACTVPDAVRAGIEGPPPPAEWYETRWVTGDEGSTVPLGVGHLRHSDRNYSVDRPPGDDDWLRRVELPLSPAPGEPANAWIVEGWVIRGDADPVALARVDQVETGYEEPSFIVLDTAPGWLLVRYAADADASAWVPECALNEGTVLLDYSAWSDWLLSGEISPLFFRADTPDDLFASPVATTPDAASPDATAGGSAIAADYHLEPLEIRGAWMRVRVKEPSDYCEFDLESEVREGWVRWFDAEVGPRVWYYTRGC